MQITATTDTNYIGNPNFELDTNGWFVAGGTLIQSSEDKYSGVYSGKFLPSGVYGFIDYPLVGMQIGASYICQAKVKAPSGQQIFIQFSTGGVTRQIATGGWDLIVSPPISATNVAFSVQIGIGTTLLINTNDSSILSEVITTNVNYGVNKQNVFPNETVTVSESIKISMHSIVGQLYVYDINGSTSDSSSVSENYSVQIGASTPFVSALNLSVGDSALVSEQYSILRAGGTQFNSALAISTSDTINTTEVFGYNADVNLIYLSGYNVAVQDTISTNEAYQVGSFKSGSLYLISVAEAIGVTDNSYQTPATSTSGAIFIDEVMLQQATTADTYFDGDSGNGYHWTGLDSASTSFYRQYETSTASHTSVPNYGVLISWTRALNSLYNFFTIGTSTIGGPDFIAGTSTFPTYFNQYQYGEYSTYLLGMSVSRNLGQFPYGAFGSQLDIQLDNSDFTFLPGFDPTIGSFIINGRPVMFQVGYQGELISLFAGTSTKPQNDIQNRTMTMTAFDGMDYLNSFISQGAGPLAAASNGYYANMPAQNIIADVLAEAGFSTSQYLFEQSLQNNIGFLAPSGLTAGSIIQSICEAEQAIFFFDENGIPQFWNREHIPTNQTLQWTFAYNSILNYQSEDTPIINDVVVQAQPRVVQAKQNIWQLTSPTIVPPATKTQTVTNLAINASFQSVTGGFFNSPEFVNVNDNILVNEMVLARSNPTIPRIWGIDTTQITEGVTVAVVFANFKPQLYETAATYESYSVKVGANAQFNSGFNVSTLDTVSTQEQVFINHQNYYNIPLIPADYSVLVETIKIKIVNASFSPVVSDSAYTDEDYFIDTTTMFGWATVNAMIMKNTSDGAPDSTTNACGLLTTSGGTGSYLFQSYTVSTNTQYVAQLQVKGISGTIVTAQIIQNNHVVASNTVLLDGSWDLLKIQPFQSENVSTSMQLRISTNIATTIKVDSVMVQAGVGSLSAYFDGSSKPTSSYIFAWSGAANQSTSIATPCGYALIEADFQDDDGDLPVTSLTAPTYNNNNLDSTFLTNLNSDGTGLNQNGNIILQSAVLNGAQYKMTFINTYTQPIYITQISLYGTPAKVTYRISQEYKDPSSIVLYGTNPANNGQPLVISNDLIQDPSTALSDAYSLVNDYSKPYQRLNADVFPNFALQIGDMVQATIDDTAQTLNYTVVGIVNSISSNGEPIQNLELEVKNLVHYFTINTSIIGGTDSIAP